MFFGYVLPLHSSPKEVHTDFIQFSWWPWVTDPDPGSCQICQMVLGENDPRFGSVTKGLQKSRVVFMCTSFGEECIALYMDWVTHINRSVVRTIDNLGHSPSHHYLCFGQVTQYQWEDRIRPLFLQMQTLTPGLHWIMSPVLQWPGYVHLVTCPII